MSKAFNLSLSQIERVLKSSHRGNYTEDRVRRAKYLINNALFFYEQDLADAQGPTRKQLLQQADAFFRSLDRFARTASGIVGARRLFQTISESGERFSERHGQDIYFPARVYKPDQPQKLPDGRDAGPPMPNAPYVHFRSNEKLAALIAHAQDVSRWRDYLQVGSPNGSSPIEDLISRHLPRVYRQIFEKRLGISRSGPGARFIQEILVAAEIKTPQGKIYSMESVIALLRKAPLKGDK